jgi:HEAT repeat protein
MPDTNDLIQALLDAVAADDDEQAEQVVRAFATLPGVLPALRPLLDDDDENRRWWAVRGLALIGGDEAERLLVEHLSDPDEPTRCAAALGLGELRSEAALPALMAALADASGWVRDSAADALSMIGVPALPGLVEAMKDTRDGIRVRASRAIGRTVGPALAGKTLNEYGREYLPALTSLYAALNDTNRLVRTNAYDTLNGLGLFDQVYIAP